MYHVHFCLTRKMLSLYLYDKVRGSENDFSSQLKGLWKEDSDQKKYVFFSRIRGVIILAYLAVTIHFKGIIDKDMQND